MTPPTNKEKNDKIARERIAKIESQEKKLDQAEKELNLIQPTPGAQTLRKQKLLDAIAKKRTSLASRKDMLKQFLASDYPAVRAVLVEEYLKEAAVFSKTESFADKVSEVCVPCKFGLGQSSTRSKTVWAEIVELTFDGDHKLLKPSPGDYEDQPLAPFAPPHWAPDHSHPVSYTKNTSVKLTARFQFSVESDPPGQTASWTKVKGFTEVWDDIGGVWMGRKALSFEGAPSTGSVQTGIYATAPMTSSGKLPDWVWDYKLRIQWFVQAEGTWLIAGRSEHQLYVTYDTPRGKMGSALTETGPVQDVTEERLQLAIVAVSTRWSPPDQGPMTTKGRRYTRSEKGCVDGVFWDLKGRGVGYSLGFRWRPAPAVNETGINPRPTLHHYLWRTMAATAKGECHNIAAGFVLMCRILGVSGAMEVGYMYPRPGRSNTPPAYAWVGGDVGAWNVDYGRSHALDGLWELLYFIDANGFGNNFEGATKYSGKYYAIGEDIYPSPSHFYGEKSGAGIWKGSFDLSFAGCDTPYPNHFRQVVQRDPETGASWNVAGFKWHNGR